MARHASAAEDELTTTAEVFDTDREAADAADAADSDELEAASAVDEKSHTADTEDATTKRSDRKKSGRRDSGAGKTNARFTRLRPTTPTRQAAIFGVASIVALSGLVGWLGYRTYQSYEQDQQREAFLRGGSEVALALTTIDFNHVDSDVAHILDSATGQFHDDFQRRSGPFADVVKKAQTTTTGTVTGAGVESVDGDEAQVLVALQVKTKNAGGEQPPHGWRMRITVQKVGDDVKASDVQFVP